MDGGEGLLSVNIAKGLFIRFPTPMDIWSILHFVRVVHNILYIFRRHSRIWVFLFRRIFQYLHLFIRLRIQFKIKTPDVPHMQMTMFQIYAKPKWHAKHPNKISERTVRVYRWYKRFECAWNTRVFDTHT